MKIQFVLNGQSVESDHDSESNLLWILRDHFGLTGTKYGCGAGVCGACTVHLNGKPVRSCLIPFSAVSGKELTTIEGVSTGEGHHVQQAWIEEQVPQCGYCQSGQIMQAISLLRENPNPTREDIIQYMDGILCRCGTYLRIIKAIQKVAQSLNQ